MSEVRQVGEVRQETLVQNSGHAHTPTNDSTVKQEQGAFGDRFDEPFIGRT